MNSMKKIVFIVLIMFLIPLIKADSIQVSSHFTETEIPRGVKIPIGNITVTNTSDMDTIIVLNSYEGFPDTHWINFSESNFTLLSGESKKITIYAGIPSDFLPDSYSVKIEVVGKFKKYNVAVLTKTDITVLETTLSLEKYKELENENKDLKETIKERDRSIENLSEKNSTQRKIIYGIGILLGILIILILLLARANIKLNRFIDKELP